MSKITALTALASTQADDVLPVVDVHDTTMAATGTTKKITVAGLLAGADAVGAAASETTRALAAEALLASKASPAFTGTPTAPTAAPLTGTTQLATTTYADSAVSVETTRAQAAEALAAQKSANLSDLASRQTALDTLAGSQASGQFPRGNGTHVVMSAIQASDIPVIILPSGDTTGAADSAAITAALTAYGVAVLWTGQFWAYNLVLAAGQYIIGQGEQLTILSLAAGHTRLLSTQNFATLTRTGTATTGVPYNFGWRLLTLDGNGANQTAQLTRPAAPTIANVGTPGTTTYTYRITWTNSLGETVGSATGVTATGNAVLDTNNYNTVTRGSPPGGATGWNVYVGGRGQEVLCNAAPVAAATSVFNDQGSRQSGGWANMPRSNTTADVLVAVYGFGWHAYAWTIHNAAGLGLWTEWAPGGAQTDPVLTDQMEAFAADFKIHHCLGGAWMCAGTHDIQVNNFLLAQNCSGAGYATLSLPAGNLVGGGTFQQYHIWGGNYDYGIYTAEAGLEVEGQVEGGFLAQLFCNASLNRIRGKLFDGGINTTTVIGLLIGTGVNNILADLKVEGCGGGVMDITGFGGDCYLKIMGTYFGAQVAPTPLYVGSLDGNSVLDLQVINNAGATAAGSGLFRGGVTFTSVTASASMTVAGANVGGQLADPVGLGFASTTDPHVMPNGSAAMFAANYAYYGAFIGYGQTTSTLRIVVSVASGNISAGTYGNGGQVGALRLPMTQKSTTGAIACPAAGTVTVSLLSAVTIARGDYGAISCDNITATFGRGAPSGNSGFGVQASQATAHPLPATAAAANGGNYTPWVATP